MKALICLLLLAPAALAQVQSPSVADSYIRGRNAGAHLRQTELENEILRQIAEENQRVAEQEAAKKDARMRKMRAQVEACIRLGAGSKQDIRKCVDRLLVNDQEFAMAFAEAQSSLGESFWIDAMKQLDKREDGQE